MIAKLKYEQIRYDGGTQPRAELLVPVMEEYAELMRAGVEFPPIDVFFDGNNYWLADGFHRLGAALRIYPDDPIEAEVTQGTQSDAQWYSFGVNKAHGLRRTNEDKERAIRAALKHPKGAGYSDRQIAEHVGVTPPTVSKYRKEECATVKNLQSTASPPSCRSRGDEGQRPRKGRDGRTINTAKIGRSAKRKAKKPRSAAELVEARRNGYQGSFTSMVKLKLPNNHVHNCAYGLLEHFTFEYLQKVFQEITLIHQERLAEEKSR